MSPIIQGAAIITAIGTIGGGALWVERTYTPRSDFNAYTAAEQAKDNRQLILDTVERAAAEMPGPYKDSLCRTLEQAVAELCAVAPDDAICMDREIYREKAGCR